MQGSKDTAVMAGRQLGSGRVALPVLLYGHADPQRRSLAEIRRALGYFTGSRAGVRHP